MNPEQRLGLAVMACLTVVAALSGCGYRLVSKGSNLPPHVRKIGVIEFGNSTTRPELGQRITEKIREELVSRGRFEVLPDAKGADGVIQGNVASWTSRPVTLSNDTSNAQRVAVTLRAAVSFEDKVERRVLWEQQGYSFTAEYDVVGEADEYFDTELGAVEEVATDFARAIVGAILQGF